MAPSASAELDLMTLPDSAMQRVRGKQIGMIFQNPMTHLDPVMADRRSDR